MQPRVASLSAALASCLLAVPSVAATGPTTAQVEAAIQKTRPMSRLAWKTVRVSSPRAASAGEAAHAGMPFPVTVYPAYVSFTETMGSSREVTWNYYIYDLERDAGHSPRAAALSLALKGVEPLPRGGQIV